MPYDISEDPYINPKTGVLRNKIGAKTTAALNRAEAEITYVIIATLTQGSDVKKLKFSSGLLCDIHKEIFRDIYAWAGKTRTQDISKELAYFAHAAHIDAEMQRLSNELATDRELGARDEFVDSLTYLYGEYNAIHPFREGNGRAIRTFLRLYALKHGYDIEWAKMQADENIAACRASMHGDERYLQMMLNRIVAEVN